jgi:hypothetical protein
MTNSKSHSHKRYLWLGIAVAVVVLTLLAWQARERMSDDVQTADLKTDNTLTTIVLNSEDIYLLYPSGENDDLNDYYKTMKDFPSTLAESVERFTEDSLARDGIQANVSATVKEGQVTIVIDSADPTATQYKTLLPKIMSNQVAGLGLKGARECHDRGSTCWNPAGGQELEANYTPSHWAFYLPLGLPMVNQKTVMLLNYPPNDALCSTDYLNNFTIDRWNWRLETVGISTADTPLYETILDSHPIAAPGSGQSGYIRNTTQYFYKKGQPNYNDAMLDLLMRPLNESRTVPLQVAGSDAREIFAKMIDREELKPGEVGLWKREGKRTIPWVATNHPNVTNYQLCPNDPLKKCDPTYGCSDELVQDELLDLQAICTLRHLAEEPTADPATVMENCKKVWCTDDNGTCEKRKVCVQARRDHTYRVGDTPDPGMCNCKEAAEAYCTANSNNACGQEWSCEVYNQKFCPTQKNDYQTCRSLAPAS